MIKRMRLRALALTSTALAASLLTGVENASAQGFFERLFNQPPRRYVEPQFPQQQQQQAPVQRQAQRAAPPQAPRVSGPQYFTYKTDALAKVNFAAITIDPALVGSGIDHGTVGATTQVTRGPSQPVTVAGGSLEEAVEKALEGNEIRGESRRRMAEPDDRQVPSITGASPKLEIDVRKHAVPSPEPAKATAATIASSLDDLATYEFYAEQAIGDAVVAHYSKHPQVIWSDGGRVNSAARDVLRELASADDYGLNPGDYAVSMPRANDEAALARFEMALSARMLRYARDIHAGRVDPNRISGYHDFELKTVDYSGLLANLADGGDARDALRALHPQNEFYKAMQVELEELRASEEKSIVIAPGTFIRPGQTNSELPKILAVIEKEADQSFLAQHATAIELNRASEVYSDDLVAVIKAAQQKRGLQVDGIIGPRTVTSFAGESKAARIEKVKLAMEQLRWLPSDFGDRYVFLNAPSATASYVEDGHERLSMRTVVGTKATQTYFFQDEISYVEFHPYWGVPRSIIVNKYLPKLYSDPSYLDRSGFEVTDQQGRQISSSAIDWPRYGANIPFNVRQRPGPGNALGELKIMFPNKHAIYMHDTPDRHLFTRDNRALSNGCVRLEDPRAMAAAVLGWDRAKVDSRLAGQHGRDNLEDKIPVYVAYFTAWPEAGGKMGYYPDVYERDLKTREAMERIEAARAPSI
ncbi:murein L,D-transpeptidase [Aliihoeflea sp. 40Bstr573]|uniref:L,D-transpeptidase family protein n=1 Tax=Aliihoeflea sp. 40Bstr573 TaxID=2696467 RepID=UPI002094A408|nr:L,D-transpeptidase family protein [Aliihoeflea sp. 40Bstr573]MCO6385568.1 L,D-transpeptidase family protein [Aliihoeflea sp. 40Bstr573]